ncbi:hypothetical protein V8E36_008910 [Tilletia maclaganii]
MVSLGAVLLLFLVEVTHGPERGLILDIGSFAGQAPTPLLATYSGSKAFFIGWAQAPGEELERHRITVRILNTYFVVSNMGKVRKSSAVIPTPKRRPAHPLALMPEKRSQARERDARMRQSWERARERGEMTGLTYRIATGVRARGAGGSSADTHPQSARVRKEEEEPPRPSALALLTAHAKHTDPAFLREALQHYPRPLALLALLGKAYFVGPFVANAGKGDTYLGALKADELKARERRAARAAASAAAAGRKRSNLDFRSNHDGSGGSVGARNGAASSERSRAPASSTSTTLESYYRLRDRGTHAWDGAMRWGSVAWESRWGWALRRMATPYGLGFLAFAWYGGDLNR